ncbi:MAG: heat shock protein HspQ [Kordiimonadaceae bacterium]|nr:heat shock protein HspQ [Kordiimonadaceae bacterium]MBO6570561.1 heat shock protein HspQ [Kordiimonadaceae bacterium]MBO6966581.1 heat shock protein HspQ [Kordiimonadaceae bacterium]
MTYVCTSRFAPGQIVRHRVYGYRGLIYDVDGRFAESDEWREKIEAFQSVDDMPWYHVLVDGESHSTYVAEENLELATGADLDEAFDHPALTDFFHTSGADTLEVRHSIN